MIEELRTEKPTFKHPEVARLYGVWLELEPKIKEIKHPFGFPSPKPVGFLFKHVLDSVSPEIPLLIAALDTDERQEIREQIFGYLRRIIGGPGEEKGQNKT